MLIASTRFFFSTWRPSRSIVFYRSEATFSCFKFLHFLEQRTQKIDLKLAPESSPKKSQKWDPKYLPDLPEWAKNRGKSTESQSQRASGSGPRPKSEEQRATVDMQRPSGAPQLDKDPGGCPNLLPKTPRPSSRILKQTYIYIYIYIVYTYIYIYIHYSVIVVVYSIIPSNTI